MDKSIKKWIWQHDEYPNYKYDKKKLEALLESLEYKRGTLDGVSKLFNSNDIQNIEIENLTNEAINTSEIEGEYLKRESVQASLLKKLDATFDSSKDTSTHQTDALVELLLDCSMNMEPLTIERLHGWHNCLFVSSYDRLHPINVASFREHDDMEVVSGAIGHEKVHYVAVPQEHIEKDMQELLEWCECSDENIYIKAAIVHLWFVSIHPYDDGNGRIARAMTDYVLSQYHRGVSQFKLYSISTAINNDRRGYYEILDRTTNLFVNRDFDFTAWLVWHLSTLNNAMDMAHKNIEYLIQKTKFWDRHRGDNLNERQVKVLNKVLDMGSENFEGGLNTKKYMSITKKSKATVVRDIQELVALGCIEQIEGTSGRNVRYEVKL
jgi:Fic family protein